ncbi:flagellar basal body-associated FliL family protein [Comamonadaceae bacterium M7527]|nr:flagellar basal body-associated FliL family protein [Comamonadaceae bacterium M7527]
MADEVEDEEEGKKGGGLLKIILIVVLVLVLLVGAVFGTLFFTGFFDKADAQAAEEQVAALEAEAEAAADTAAAVPQRVTKESPELTRFEYHYKELEREFLANLTNSRKVIQVQMAIMTNYDERVFANVDKHQFALRSAVLDALRQTTEADLVKPDFRKELAMTLKVEMNTVLEKYEDFGGIEEVYFTNFVVQ